VVLVDLRSEHEVVEVGGVGVCHSEHGEREANDLCFVGETFTLATSFQVRWLELELAKETFHNGDNQSKFVLNYKSKS